jgi:hypothetical protein
MEHPHHPTIQRQLTGCSQRRMAQSLLFFRARMRRPCETAHKNPGDHRQTTQTNCVPSVSWRNLSSSFFERECADSDSARPPTRILATIVEQLKPTAWHRCRDRANVGESPRDRFFSENVVVLGGLVRADAVVDRGAKVAFRLRVFTTRLRPIEMPGSTPGRSATPPNPSRQLAWSHGRASTDSKKQRGRSQPSPTRGGRRLATQSLLFFSETFKTKCDSFDSTAKERGRKGSVC